MTAALYTLYVLNCLFLILVVLLQAGRGGGMSAFGGGSSNTVFGAGGASTFLQKLTVGSAVMFMVLSLIIAWRSSTKSTTDAGTFDTPEEIRADDPLTDGHEPPVTDPAPVEQPDEELAPVEEPPAIAPPAAGSGASTAPESGSGAPATGSLGETAGSGSTPP